MIETHTVVVCAESKAHWYQDCEPAKCSDESHEHQLFEVHRHRSLVALPNGARITAVSFDEADPYERAQPPDYGLYLDPRWQPPWDHDHLDWPDFDVPRDVSQVTAALRSLLGPAGGGQRVEMCCIGGHGRTGTALACLAILSGHPRQDAGAWVRANYCGDAVETAEQADFVTAFDRQGGKCLRMFGLLPM
jgi:hypothetical protein